MPGCRRFDLNPSWSAEQKKTSRVTEQKQTPDSPGVSFRQPTIRPEPPLSRMSTRQDHCDLGPNAVNQHGSDQTVALSRFAITEL
jgi:hypothetical protein